VSSPSSTSTNHTPTIMFVHLATARAVSTAPPTPPAEAGGYETTRFNALRHGVLSRYTVLPWEDADEYRALVAALAAEHTPQGPTEEHLVEELAGILWRKRRLRLAEAATYRRGLKERLSPYHETATAALVHLGATGQFERVVDAIRATADETAEDIAEMEEDEAMTRRALDLLDSSRNDAYEAALAALCEDTRQWWEDGLARDPDEREKDAKPYTADRPAPALRSYWRRLGAASQTSGRNSSRLNSRSK
jgi:hypothetical protein